MNTIIEGLIIGFLSLFFILVAITSLVAVIAIWKWAFNIENAIDWARYFAAMGITTVVVGAIARFFVYLDE